MNWCRWTALSIFFLAAPVARAGGPDVSDCVRQLLPFKVEADLESIYENPLVSVFRTVVNGERGDTVYKTMPLYEALNDDHAFRVLRKENRKLSHPIRIIETTLVTPNEGEMDLNTRVLQKGPALEGRTLFDVLRDPSVPAARKEALVRRFEAWLDEMKIALERLNYRADSQPPHVRFFGKYPDTSLVGQPRVLDATRPWRSLMEGDFDERKLYVPLERVSRGRVHTLLYVNETIHILLKSDNVMVDPEDQLTLFDPW
jgi:hypothetical protein